jgi:hypothetical protein
MIGAELLDDRGHAQVRNLWRGSFLRGCGYGRDSEAGKNETRSEAYV